MMNQIRLPAEWAEQSAVLLAWPQPAGHFEPWHGAVEATYVEITEAISRRQTLIIACVDRQHCESIQRRLKHSASVLERIQFMEVPFDDVWVRDTAPLSVETTEGALLLDFQFNGWGGKYPCERDAAFADSLCRSGLFGATPWRKIDFVLEGGSIDGDGEGTLLTTRRCLLNPNRNPSLSEAAIEDLLRKEFGARRVLWLDHGIAEGDDTDAHVDTLARFCDAQTIAYTACERKSDPQYQDLTAMESELRSFRTELGLPYQLVALPIPRPIMGDDGSRLPATYANFLILNGAVLVPAYDDPNDAKATERLAACFPGREMVPIDCRSLIHQFGSLHCMTMQFPKSVSVVRP